ncbi:hypothetical protein AQI88_41140 [Streptomyces cellostaticus]|uniref:Uncharacterized protein n=1 Tax=Streptomyces cellostaticus TaxID=67285 RepID=A0A101N543_9ACTN|nr:hypothetical protein AQI88_41140 [Streptomyces cellostaticus]
MLAFGTTEPALQFVVFVWRAQHGADAVACSRSERAEHLVTFSSHHEPAQARQLLLQQLAAMPHLLPAADAVDRRAGSPSCRDSSIMYHRQSS